MALSKTTSLTLQTQVRDTRTPGNGGSQLRRRLRLTLSSSVLGMPGRVILVEVVSVAARAHRGHLCGMANPDAGTVVRRFYEGWNSGSIDFSGLVAEDIVNHQPEAEPEQGQQRFEEAIRNVMRAVPDSHWTVTDLLTDGDRVAARTIWSGTYQAQMFRGITIPAPARFSVEHVHIYRITEGRLIEHWVVRDDLTMLRQLGALPNQSPPRIEPRRAT